MEIDLKPLEKILEGHAGDPSALIEALQDVQKRFKWLPKEAVNMVADRLNVPRSRAYAVATFYSAFSLEPKGKRVVRLCRGTACHVRGSAVLEDRISEMVAVAPNHTAKDLSWTFETVACLGACAMAPVAVVDGKYYGGLKLNDLEEILKPGKE